MTNRLEVFVGVGFGVGLFLGMLTVFVVPTLRLTISASKIGLWSGVGTGLAYFFSNLPWVFQMSPAMQCAFCGIVGLLGLFLVGTLPRDAMESFEEPVPGSENGKSFFGPTLVLFFFLVWLDSAAFYVIQETDSLKAAAWGTPNRLWGNGLFHLFFGVVSGVMIDRGRLIGVLTIAMLFLVGGSLWLTGGYRDVAWLGAVFYVSGVSLYSTGLVASIAKQGEMQGQWPMAKRAALLFALAGWVSSGMGIGMARDLGTIPYLFLLVALAACLGVNLWLARLVRRTAA
ncbi:hypothetical protein [Pelagicoccus albus]|uniref:Major facilitator superfamily (MFS) profile domain-containing protein n=1 Tax=Pelagicoccus albus TaxID=415222 RepID=A0A7X1B7J2_9BACT|nr:hypothetical protein [Pelagicoccus albus]MBC2607121.1 hypothetical protein [Pelagicoccus albus]